MIWLKDGVEYTGEEDYVTVSSNRYTSLLMIRDVNRVRFEINMFCC